MMTVRKAMVSLLIAVMLVAAVPVWAQLKPISNATVKYTVFMNQAIAEYPPDGGEAKIEMIKRWKDQLGITNTDYDVLLVGGSDYKTKLNAMLAGGDVPDFFNVNIEDIGQLIANKIIAPIDDMVAMMPVYKNRVTTDPASKASYENFKIDGKHYGFVTTALVGPLNGDGVNGLALRTDWLKKVGKPVPKTLAELHDVLVAFAKNDPDGNGQADTYGFGGDKGQKFKTLFAAYGIYLDGANSWTKVGGKLVHSSTTPEAKQVMALLQAWYKEGLIDPDMFVIEGKQAKDKLIASKFGAIETTVWWANDARTAWATSNPAATIAMITPPKGPKGAYGLPIAPVKTQAFVVSKKCMTSKDPARFAKILDWMNDESDKGGFNFTTYGIEGKHFAYDRAKGVIDQSLFNNVKTKEFSNLYSLGYSNPIRWLQNIDRRWIPKGDPRELDLTIPNNWMMPEFSGAVPAMKDYPDLFSKLWAETFTKIVTGALPVDAHDEYVKKFMSQGGKELTDQVNAAWAAKK